MSCEGMLCTEITWLLRRALGVCPIPLAAPARLAAKFDSLPL